MVGKASKASPSAPPFAILFENEALLCINKRAEFPSMGITAWTKRYGTTSPLYYPNPFPSSRVRCTGWIRGPAVSFVLSKTLREPRSSAKPCGSTGLSNGI